MERLVEKRDIRSKTLARAFIAPRHPPVRARVDAGRTPDAPPDRSSLHARRSRRPRARGQRGHAVVSLRELAREDIPLVNRWRQDRDLVDGLGAPARYITEEVDHQWFDEYLRRRGIDVRCAILVEGETDPVGLVSLTGIDPVHRRAELHLLIG